MWIPKEQLHVDRTYQRDLNEHKVLKIAREWHWPSFGVCIVAKRADGIFFIVDAQHRHAASLRRSDVQNLPCIVFLMEGTNEEAAAFLQANAGRKPVTAIDKYRAMLVTGDPVAVRVSELLQMTGKEVSATRVSGAVKCVALLLKLSGSDHTTLEKVWPLLCDLYGSDPVHERALDAFFYVEKNACDGESLILKKWRERVIRIGRQAFMKSIGSSVSFYARGGARIWGMGVLQALNHGLQDQNRFRVNGISEQP